MVCKIKGKLFTRSQRSWHHGASRMQQKGAFLSLKFLLIDLCLQLTRSTEITGPVAIPCLFQLWHSDLPASTLAQHHSCAPGSYVSTFMSQHYFRFSVLTCLISSQSLISQSWVVSLLLPFKEPFGPDFISYCFSSMQTNIFTVVSQRV